MKEKVSANSLISVEQLAELAGVSRSTVYAVIHQRSWVSPAKRERVEQLLRDNRWRLRSQLGTTEQSSLRVAVIFRDLLNPYNARLVEGAARPLRSRGYLPLVISTHDSPEQEKTAVQMAMQQQVEGILLAPRRTDGDLEHLWRVKSQGVTVVTKGAVPGFSFCNFDVDGYQVGLIATRYLLQRGHRRLVLLKGNPGLPECLRRVEGFRDAYAQHNLPVHPDQLVVSGSTIQDGYQSSLPVLQRPQRPTAIVAHNDLCAAGVYLAARECGLRIPQDLSVVGVDDIELAPLLGPALTTVKQPCFSLGELMGKALLANINGGNEQGRLLPAHLVERESVARHVEPPR